MAKYLYILFLCFFTFGICEGQNLKINKNEYFELPGLNVMVFNDIYPEGHQGGLGIIQNGTRVATNGDLRLEPTPGQWQPIPKVGNKKIEPAKNTISVSCWYPDSSKNKKGFNPVFYPDLSFTYTVRVIGEGRKFRIIVDLDKPLPANWQKQVGFNLELFPGVLFGKGWYMDNQSGIFETQPSGPMEMDANKQWQAKPIATGKKLIIVPEDSSQRLKIESTEQPLQLLDGRFYHNNGWYVVRSLVSPNKTGHAVEWIVEANILKNFISDAVVHVSQVGYHPKQAKIAVLETDGSITSAGKISLVRYNDDGVEKVVMSTLPKYWGRFLRFNYFQFDFSEIKEEGIYRIRYNQYLTQPFQVKSAVYDYGVWQPTLEYFLPIQMCHMRVNEGYRVWHGLCHADDALMAPTDTNHFDGYFQGHSTLTKYKPYEQVPGLNVGGWHDAGDYDLRVESQAETVRILSLVYEEFDPKWDQTLVDQQHHLVEIHHPDGKDDILQQVEHGLLSILGGYKNLGRLYRGIICNSLQQYVLLGDGINMTDGLKYSPALKSGEKTGTESGTKDDRWVFTENNPARKLEVARALAAGSRVMKGFNDSLSLQSLRTAEELYNGTDIQSNSILIPAKIKAAIELLLSTNIQAYAEDILNMTGTDALKDREIVAYLPRVFNAIRNKELTERLKTAARKIREEVNQSQEENPFGVPYHPYIWGDGWAIQSFGVQQYFLHKSYPEIFSAKYVLNAVNFILGCHPGENTSSFVSGVGSHSVTVAYGANRADWSFIPGGSVSGTGIIRPDFPELKVWPYFWQQTEYVMGEGGTDFLFLTLAASHLCKEF